jgi:hypothetical protein
MKNFKLFIGAILMFVCLFIIAAIDSFSTGGVVLAMIAAYFFGRDGIRLINKYGKKEMID